METVVFWVLWGFISFWALKTFYFSFSQEKVERLRKASLGFSCAVLILSFLPWVPSSPGGLSGIGLALEGNFLALLFLILLLNSLVLFFQKEMIFLKIGSVLTFLSTIVLFALMLALRPGTFILSWYDIAPIVAVFMLLCQNVAVLLLWQQLDLQKKEAVAPNTKKKIKIGLVSLAIFSFGILIVIQGKESQIPEPVEEPEVVLHENLEEKRFETFPVQEAGQVCFGEGHFSFQIDSPYTVMSDDKNGVALFATEWLVTVSTTGNSIVETLGDFGVPYTKDGEMYSYQMLSGERYGVSQEKNGLVVSVFSSQEDDEDALQLLSQVVESLQEGCTENE
ncbi:hypothetical protein HY468_04360 [Candidatus Roizmanbacteria bacterium]|nr:hypothetical protein [Candidatus Roizmanbacteria bacterium]